MRDAPCVILRVPSVMKALIPTGNLQAMVRVADVAEADAAPDEAIVSVEAFSINRGETFLLEAPKAGWRPGKDVSGRVLRAAADGSGPTVGTRVVGHPSSRGWAERVAVPVRQLATLPDTIDSVTAAALPLAGLTALRLMRAVGPLASRRILLTGASGGVGHVFTELASAAGADVIAVVASAERGRRLLELGAERVVLNVDDAPKEMDVVLESVGGASLTTALSRLTPRGLMIWFGQAARVPATIDFFSFFDRHRSKNEKKSIVAGTRAACPNQIMRPRATIGERIAGEARNRACRIADAAASIPDVRVTRP